MQTPPSAPRCSAEPRTSGGVGPGARLVSPRVRSPRSRPGPAGAAQPAGRFESHCNCKRHTVVLAVIMFLGLIIAVIVLAVLLSERSSAVLSPWCPACPDGWVGYRGKCYYFSEAKGNWTYSRSNCSSLGASLAGIDTQQDLDFMLRYKGRFDHWIGLRRDPGQPWKWANGTEFNNLFLITADGDCAYLTENGVSSLRCTSERYWICTSPDPFTKAKGG